MLKFINFIIVVCLMSINSTYGSENKEELSASTYQTKKTYYKDLKIKDGKIEAGYNIKDFIGILEKCATCPSYEDIETINNEKELIEYKDKGDK